MGDLELESWRTTGELARGLVGVFDAGLDGLGSFRGISFLTTSERSIDYRPLRKAQRDLKIRGLSLVTVSVRRSIYETDSRGTAEGLLVLVACGVM